MDLFHIIEDVQAIIRVKGLLKQVNVYRRGVRIYVKLGTGYAQALARGDTTVPNCRVVDMSEHDSIAKEGGQYNAPHWTGDV